MWGIEIDIGSSIGVFCDDGGTGIRLSSMSIPPPYKNLSLSAERILKQRSAFPC